MAHSPLRADSACANPIGRREALATLALSQFATIPVARALAPSSLEGWKPLPAAAKTGDANFWQMHAQRMKIDAEWEASFQNTPSDMSDEEMNDWGALHREAERAMMAAPITTLTALRAKLAYIKTGEMDVLHGDDEYPSIIDLILRDADRIVGEGEAGR